MKLNKKSKAVLEMVNDNPKYEIVHKTGDHSVQTKDGTIVKQIDYRTWNNLYFGRFIDPNGKIFGAHFYKISDKGREAIGK